MDADWGYVLTYCIKDLDGEIHNRIITPAQIRNSEIRDRKLLEQFYRDSQRYDKLIVYYGKDSGLKQRHDIPFLRTRAVKWGVPFPEWKQIKITDVYDIIRGKFKLSRRSMDAACRFFDIPSKATPLNPDVWQDALAAKQWALDYILQHNIEDVISLENLWKKVIQYKGTETTT